jgi:TonB family protein
MIRDNIVKKSFFVSIIFHLALLVPWRGVLYSNSDRERFFKTEPVVVSYKISREEQIEFEDAEAPEEVIEAEDSALESEFSEEVKEDIIPEDRKYEQEAYFVEEDEVVSLSGKIDSSIVSENLINYYSSIREEIKKKAFYYKPNEGRGTVTVLFSIDSEGLLKKLAIDEVRSTDRNNLRTAALKSVRHAAPFSPFPSELKNSLITFSITIEFALGANY